MARKYYFKFKTFQNHTCRVDIYDADYSGTAIELSKDVAGSPGCPADSPVTIEEDNSDDLLEVVRTKTGYLRLIELTAGGLSDIFPQRNDQLEVYVLIDVADSTAAPDAPMETVFHGYIQAKSPQMDFAPYNQELKIPIQSVVSTIGDQTIDPDHVSSVADIFINNFSEYDYLVLPALSVKDLYNRDINVLQLRIMPEVLTPQNDNYDYGVRQTSAEEDPLPLEPITKQEFLEKFCLAFGLMCHEVGVMLVFTKIGFTGQYTKYANDGTWQSNYWSAGSGNTVNSFATNFGFASDNNDVSYRNSLHNLFLEWKEIGIPQSIDFSIAKHAAGDGIQVFLDYKGIQIVSSHWMSGTDTGLGATIVGDGKDEFLCIDDTNMSVGSVNDAICWCRFSSPGTITGIHIEAPNIHTIQSTMIVIRNNAYDGQDLYYNFDNPNQWVPNTPENESKIYGSLAALHTNGVMDIPVMLWGIKHLEIGFVRRLSVGASHFHIKTLEANAEDVNLNKYTHPDDQDNKIRIALDESSYDNAEINVDFWQYNYGIFNKPTYAYLGDSQRNLKLQLRKKTSIAELDLLIGKFALSSTDQKNRVISTRYNVRDDIFELQIMGNQYF